MDSDSELAEPAGCNWLETSGTFRRSKCRVIAVQLAWPLKLRDLKPVPFCVRLHIPLLSKLRDDWKAAYVDDAIWEL